MDKIREYLICVTAAAIICGIVKLLMGEKGTISAMVKMICGVFLCITVAKPLLHIELLDFTAFTNEFSRDASDAVARGEDAADRAMSSIIKSRAEAYILDKAASFGADITVDITLSDEEYPVPCMARIQGAVSPYARECLRQALEHDLGVPKEAQIWVT